MKRAGRALLIALLVLATGVPAGAAPLPLVCQATGELQFLGLNGVEFEDVAIHGTGSCTGDLGGPYTVAIDGVGEWVPFGICAYLEGSLDVTVSVTNVRTATTTTFNQVWETATDPVLGSVRAVVVLSASAPLTSPSLVRGAGVIVSRLFSPLVCLNLVPESDSALFRWAFLR